MSTTPVHPTREQQLEQALREINDHLHTGDAPSELLDRIDALLSQPQAEQSEREARDWEMAAQGIESVIHYVVSKHDQDLLRRHAADKRAEGKRIRALAPAQTEQQPVAAQIRYRHPQKTMPAWSAWQQAPVDMTKPTWWVDSVGYENEYRLLYAAPIAPAPQEQSGLVGQVCGGDAQHNTVNVAVVGSVPWADLRIGTPVRLIPAPALPQGGRE